MPFCQPRRELSRLTRKCSPEPPNHVLKHISEVYRLVIHFQPLPLLRLDRLVERLGHGPPFLRWSFLALTLSFSSHPFYANKESEAIEFYTRSAGDLTNRLAADGLTSLDLTQSLCLQVLGHLKGRDTFI